MYQITVVQHIDGTLTFSACIKLTEQEIKEIKDQDQDQKFQEFQELSIVINTDIINDTDYVEAIEILDKSPILNMDKAKEIHRKILRRKRVEFFDILDKNFIEALSRSKEQSTIKERQNYIRNITEDPRIDKATSIDELKKIVIKFEPIIVNDLKYI